MPEARAVHLIWHSSCQAIKILVLWLGFGCFGGGVCGSFFKKHLGFQRSVYKSGLGVAFFSLHKLREIVSFALKLIAEIYIVEDRITGGFLPFLILLN